MRVLIAATVLLAASAAHAEKPRSIVGLWAFDSASCTEEAGAIRLGPKSMKGTDVYCRFRSVERKGNTVIWKGPCDDAEGSSEQTVTAVEKDGKLTITYTPGGNVLEGLGRCEE